MSRTSRRTWALSLAATLVLLAGCRGGADEPAASPTTQPMADVSPAPVDDSWRDAQLASFDQAWELVADTHYDADMNGLDWDEVRDTYRPQIEEAATKNQARGAIRGMLGELGESHYSLLPREAFDAVPIRRETSLEPEEPGRFRGPGIDIVVVGGRALISHVWDDAAPEAAQPGAEIRQIRRDGETIDVRDAIATMDDALPGTDTQREFALRQLVVGALTGPADETVAVTLEDIDRNRTDVELARVAPRGEEVQFGNLPPIPLDLEQRTIETRRGPVKYVRFSAFFAPQRLIPAFQQSVREANDEDAAGFIIDLRGNPGGMVGLTNGIAGFFVDQPNLELGTMRQRGTALRVVVFPRPPTFDGPLAVLIDGGSISSSEILAGGFKALGRARLFGTRTAGASLPSVIEELPSGDRLQYAIADYVAANGERLEGVGVPPHVRVLPDRRSLSEGLDPIEQAALDWIVKQDRQADAAEEDQRPTL